MPLQAQVRPTLLLACTTRSLALLHPLLAEMADVVAAFALDDAVRRLADEPALIVCNMKFDDSRMLDLAAEASRRYPHIPFVCCRTSQSELSPAGVQAARTAASNLGAAEFFDLFAMSAELGPQHAARLFKEGIAQILSRPTTSPPRPAQPNRPA
jgi:hypothetical protein